MWVEYEVREGKTDKYWRGKSSEEPTNCEICGEHFPICELEEIDGLLVCEDCAEDNVCECCGRVGEGRKCKECIEYEKGGGLE